MTAYLVVLAMAAVGIGGGLAILALVWFRDERRLRQARHRCSVGVHSFGMTVPVCDYRIFGLPGVERGPNWRWERFVDGCEGWNAQLKRQREEIQSKVAALQFKIEAMRDNMETTRREVN